MLKQFSKKDFLILGTILILGIFLIILNIMGRFDFNNNSAVAWGTCAVGNNYDIQGCMSAVDAINVYMGYLILTCILVFAIGMILKLKNKINLKSNLINILGFIVFLLIFSSTWYILTHVVTSIINGNPTCAFDSSFPERACGEFYNFYGILIAFIINSSIYLVIVKTINKVLTKAF